MTSRNMRISLVTAAVIAALAATSCGTNGLNEGMTEDTDLISSTSRPGNSELISTEMKKLSELEFEELKPLIPLGLGEMPVGHDSYIHEVSTHEVEAQVGVGFDGESFQPIFEEVLRIDTVENELAYAQWGFDGAHSDQVIKYVKVHGSGDFKEDGGFYIAVSDYEKQQYKIHGPFQQFDDWLNVGSIESYSANGRCFLSLICFDGDTMNVRGLTLDVGNPQTASTD